MRFVRFCGHLIRRPRYTKLAGAFATAAGLFRVEFDLVIMAGMSGLFPFFASLFEELKERCLRLAPPQTLAPLVTACDQIIDRRIASVRVSALGRRHVGPGQRQIVARWRMGQLNRTAR